MCAWRKIGARSRLLEHICSGCKLGNRQDIIYSDPPLRLFKTTRGLCLGIHTSIYRCRYVFKSSPGFFINGISNETYALRLVKNLYGTKQASRKLFELLSAGLSKRGFSLNSTDPCIFMNNALSSHTWMTASSLPSQMKSSINS